MKLVMTSVILQKLTTYRELLRTPDEGMLDHDVDLLVLLSKDPDVQAWIEENRARQNDVCLY